MIYLGQLCSRLIGQNRPVHLRFGEDPVFRAPPVREKPDLLSLPEAQNGKKERAIPRGETKQIHFHRQPPRIQTNSQNAWEMDLTDRAGYAIIK